MKHYKNNPRKISETQLLRLKEKLEKLGDLSGVVHNKRTNEIIAGNQRMSIFGEKSKPVIVEKYEEADEQGTLAWGFVKFQEKKYNYRLADWDEQTAREANIAANLEGGDWDWDILAEKWGDISEFGFTENLFESWERDFRKLGEFLESKPFTGEEKLNEVDEEIRPRKLLHILISVDLENSVETVLDIREQITGIETMPGVEIVYGAN